MIKQNETLNAYRVKWILWTKNGQQKEKEPNVYYFQQVFLSLINIHSFVSVILTFIIIYRDSYTWKWTKFEIHIWILAQSVELNKFFWWNHFMSSILQLNPYQWSLYSQLWMKSIHSYSYLHFSTHD